MKKLLYTSQLNMQFQRDLDVVTGEVANLYGYYVQLFPKHTDANLIDANRDIKGLMGHIDDTSQWTCDDAATH